MKFLSAVSSALCAIALVVTTPTTAADAAFTPPHHSELQRRANAGFGSGSGADESNVNACTYRKGQLVADTDSVWACLHSIPFNENVRTTTIESMTKAYELYAFQDIAANPPPSEGLFYHQVQIQEELALRRHKQYVSDFAFHSDLAAVMRRLGDAHTRYIQPVPYRAFTFEQPLNLISYVDDASGEQIVAVAPSVAPDDVKAFYREHYNVKLEVFAGRRVYTINGEDALTHIVRFADNHIGVSKDIGTRVNMAFLDVDPDATRQVEPQSLISGAFTHRNNDWAPFPADADTTRVGVNYGFVPLKGDPNGPAPVRLPKETVTFPWLCRVVADVDGHQDMLHKWMAKPLPPLTPPTPVNKTTTTSTTTSSTMDGSFADVASLYTRRTRAPKACMPSKGGAGGDGDGPSDCYTLLHEAGDVHFYTMTGRDDMVIMYLDSFEPAGDNGSNYFEGNVSLGLELAYRQGRDKVILDLSQNGGGDICLGRHVAAYLFPSVLPYGPSDMPNSMLATTMAVNAVKYNVSQDTWSADSWARDSDGKQFTLDSADWLTRGRTVTRGGRTRTVSQLLHLSTGACSYDKPVPKHNVKISAVKIVTRGLCGSTCAFVADHAAQLAHVETVVVGGLTNAPMQYTSFPGLQVLDTPALWQSIANYLAPTVAPARVATTNPLMPPPLPVSARYRMCVREIYPLGHTDRPTEYTFQRATHHMANTLASILRPEQTWFDVARLFDSSDDDARQR